VELEPTSVRSIEQYLFTKALSMAEQRGKPIRLAIVAANESLGRNPEGCS